MPEPPVLGYAPAPPRDRAKVVREADGFILTIPPKLSWRFAVWSAVVVGLGLLLILSAAWPHSTWAIAVRAIATAMGYFLLYCFANLFSRRRTWALLSLRNGILTATVPRPFGASDRRFSLSDYRDATLKSKESNGSLVLVQTDGSEQMLLEAIVYRKADLQFAASILQDAIKRLLDADFVRKQAELENAFSKLDAGVAAAAEQADGR
jgi:hypothetical protein